MSSLDEMRNKIDIIDRQLAELFEKRMLVVKEVAEYKAENHMDILDTEREKKVIIRNVSILKNHELRSEAEEFFRSLMDISRAYQAKNMKHSGVNTKEMPVECKKSGDDKMQSKPVETAGNLYGLIGEKLGHSFSPSIHSLIMDKLNIKGCYHLFEIERENLSSVIKALKYMNIKGLNVTIPYKVQVMKELDEISPEAKRIGAVNTICFDGGKACGYNTDYYGFGMMLRKFKVNVSGSRALVLGCGGATASVIQYLLDNGIGDIVAASRDKLKAKEKFKNLNVCGYDEIQYIKGFDIIINCTPCGMYPKTGESAVPPEAIDGFSTAIDLVYNPQETLFLKYAKERGLKAVNGLYMLTGQAIRAQELWNGINIPDTQADEIFAKAAETVNSGGEKA